MSNEELKEKLEKLMEALETCFREEPELLKPDVKLESMATQEKKLPPWEPPVLRIDPVNTDGLLTEAAEAVHRTGVAAVTYEKDGVTYMTTFLSLIAPKARIPEAAKLLADEFNRFVADGLAVSTLAQLSTMELADPAIYQLQMELVLGKTPMPKERPPYDKHAVFIFFHTPADRMFEVKSRFLVREGEVGKYIEDIKEFEE